MHPRNSHKDGYHFAALIKAYPALTVFVQVNPLGRQTIDFSCPKAVKALNAALLKLDYHIDGWDIPAGYLCPPIPGRADYIHAIADLIYGHVSGDKQSVCVKNKDVRGLDIGTGANLIYPIVGKQLYDWQFVASDIDKRAVANASAVLLANKNLLNSIQLRHQTNSSAIFDGVINLNEQYTFSMCNPHFILVKKEALAGATRKLHNLKQHKMKRSSKADINASKHPQKPTRLNFAGQHNELWCKGGEVGFISRMISESITYKHQVKWFTTLVSKKESLVPIKKYLDVANPSDVQIIEMGQGNKRSRFIAWQF